jgi:hypothetical protein
MIHIHSAVSVKLVYIFIICVITPTANASLPECASRLGIELASECARVEPLLNDTQSFLVKEPIPVQPIKAVLADFQVDQNRAANAIPESAPLLLLIGALLAVALVRAKSCNTK